MAAQMSGTLTWEKTVEEDGRAVGWETWVG